MDNGRAEKDTLFFIPHSHWEGAVFKTREEYLEMGWPIILRALRLLKKYSSYRFVFDQVCLVKPFLERHPEEAETFRGFVKEGRLAIVGGLHVMPDVNMPGGESFVRQILCGKQYFRRELGLDVTIGWQLDTFGHHAQIPQLLRLAGYRSLWAMRGLPDEKLPMDLVWEGLDGTRIPFYQDSYAMAYGSPKSPLEFSEFMKERYARLAQYSLGPGRAGLAGRDVCLPEEHVPPRVEEFNRQPETPFQIRIGLPSDYEAIVEKRSVERPLIKGDLNPIFRGTYSSRIELKQMTRELERLLTAAEKLGVLLASLGESVDSEILWRAWEPMLFNQAHDLMSGVMTDHVYEDTIRSFDLSTRLAREEVESRLRRLTSRIDTRGEGVPVVVFNPLSWPRTDVVYADAGLTDEGIDDLKLTGPDGQSLPVQILEAHRSDDGTLRHVKFAFIARDVPALGHAVYHLIPSRLSACSTSAATADRADNALENEFFRLEVDGASGAITSLLVKAGNWNALSGSGNVAAREEDRGDLWELYHPLKGGRVVAKDPHGPPQPGKAIFSTDQTGPEGTGTRGPVFSELTASHAFGDKGRFQTAVRLYAGLRRIDVRTKILNNDQFVRYRLLFPTSIPQGQGVHEIPFGAVERPEGIECPAQNWMDYGNHDKGIALLNRGIPGNNIADGIMMLSLMRSTRIVAYGYGGGYEPGMTSDSGFEMGKELTFDYALVPHTDDWRKAGIYRDGHEFNHPLMACTAAAHPGTLPPQWGFIEISHPNAVVSALKPGESGGAVLRIYEATGTPVKGLKIKCSRPIAAAEEVNLMEDPGRQLPVSTNTLHLDLRPFEIKTIKIEVRVGQ